MNNVKNVIKFKLRVFCKLGFVEFFYWLWFNCCINIVFFNYILYRIDYIFIDRLYILEIKKNKVEKFIILIEGKL